MFTSITDPAVKTQVITSFATPTSPPHIVIATLAFGMGIDCRDVRTIINLGPPEDIYVYIQQTGRAGRDGAPVRAILLWNQSNAHFIQSMSDYCKNSTVCRRDFCSANMIITTHVRPVRYVRTVVVRPVVVVTFVKFCVPVSRVIENIVTCMFCAEYDCQSNLEVVHN